MAHTNLKIHSHYDNNIDVVEHDCDYLATGNVYLADDSIDDCYINFEFEAIIKMDYENDIDDIDLEIMLIEMENVSSDFLQHKAYFKTQIENWLNDNCKAKIQQLQKASYEF